MEQIDLNKIYFPNLKEEEKIGINIKKALKLYDPDDFEAFICEWVKYCKYKNKNISIYNIGGTGDHGIDISVFFENKELIYQCKRFEKPLNESQVKTIITKVLWYYFKDFNALKHPDSIEIIALNDFNINAARLFENKLHLKKAIIEYYISALESEKIKYDKNDLDSIEKYLNAFSFNLTKQTKIEDVIKEYRASDVSFFRFKEITPRFERRNVDDIVRNLPDIYVNQVKNVLSEQKFSEEDKKEYINIAKTDFYSAISLKETCFYFFGKYDEFEKIENNVISLIDTLKFNTYNSKFDRMQTILRNVINLPLDDSYLVYSLHMVNNMDRKGTCHWLVNNGKFNWE